MAACGGTPSTPPLLNTLFMKLIFFKFSFSVIGSICNGGWNQPRYNVPRLISALVQFTMANAVHCTEGPRLKSAAVQCTAYATVHCTTADFSLATIYLSRCGTFHWGWNQRWYNVLRLMRYIVPWLKSRLISAVVQCTASAAVHLSSGDPVFSEQSPPSTWHFAVWVPDFMGRVPDFMGRY